MTIVDSVCSDVQGVPGKGTVVCYVYVTYRYVTGTVGYGRLRLLALSDRTVAVTRRTV